MSDAQTITHYLQNDKVFNTLFPPSAQPQAQRHWTPLHITRQAVDFFGREQESSILDIGSGVGKFCLAGAAYAPNLYFFGVEQRPSLSEYAVAAKQTLGLSNVSFIEGNFTQVDLRRYNHFYFYNSFHENLDDSDRIDEQISYSESLYEYYVRHLYHSLRMMPAGTKIVTYHALWDEMPREYRLEDTREKGLLKFWIKW